uniref:Amine oxidase domain-containing protein n=1 Tax=Sander lucioperca TaxID=283035 RepID=A0A8C9XLE0_SANLU
INVFEFTFTLCVLLLLLTLYHSPADAVSLKENLADCLNDTDYDELLQTVKYGLPHINTSHHVVIVGAGMAGLTAAKALLRIYLFVFFCSDKVTIIESSGRVGGWVETYRNEEEGWYAELGAMRIPKMNIKLNEFIMYDPNTFYLVNGLLKKTYIVQNDPDVLKYNVTPSEKGKSADELLQQALQKVRETEERKEGWKESYTNSHPWKANVFFFVLVLSLDVIFTFNPRSKNIKGQKSSVTVFPLPFCPGKNQAKAALFIDFDQPLSSEDGAMRAVQYDSSTKISHLQREQKGIYYCNCVTFVTRFIYYPSHSFPTNKTIGVLLASYTWSDDSLLFLGTSDEDLKELVLRDLAKIHGEYVKSLCTGVLVKRWSADPHSLGAFALFTPYQHLEHSKELFRSEGRVHFAGEHTAVPHAWIGTSMKSAIRAATNINKESATTQYHDVYFLGQSVIL